MIYVPNDTILTVTPPCECRDPREGGRWQTVWGQKQLVRMPGRFPPVSIFNLALQHLLHFPNANCTLSFGISLSPEQIHICHQSHKINQEVLPFQRRNLIHYIRRPPARIFNPQLCVLLLVLSVNLCQLIGLCLYVRFLATCFHNSKLFLWEIFWAVPAPRVLLA